MTWRDLQSSVGRSVDLQDAAVVAFQAELRRVLSRLTQAMRVELRGLDVDEAGRATRSVRNLIRIFALRRQARQLLDRAGFDGLVVRALGDPLDRLAASILSGVESGIRGPNVRETMAAWRELRLAELLSVGDGIGRALQRVALDGVLGLRPVDRLILDVRDVLDLSERQARTFYDTVVSVFTRQVEQVTSDGDEDELFVYIGPDDEKTRPFCDAWLGKVRTREAIATLDNGQLPDVMLTGGGYNCRHLWKRVSLLDDELRGIAGTDKRAQDVLREAA